MNCVRDLYNVILKLKNNDTLHNPMYQELSPLLQWKPGNLMEQLSNICVYISTLNNTTNEAYNITTNMDDEVVDNIGLETITPNICSESR